jgi:hypothetical protein
MKARHASHRGTPTIADGLMRAWGIVATVVTAAPHGVLRAREAIAVQMDGQDLNRSHAEGSREMNTILIAVLNFGGPVTAAE